MDKAMEKDFWAVWDKYRKKKGVTVDDELGRPQGPIQMPEPDAHDEL
jgi:DnaJ-related protein SCJ1